MGFELQEILSLERSKRGLGLTSMRERAELSGGTFVMESTIGKGTTLKAAWPIGFLESQHSFPPAYRRHRAGYSAAFS